MKDGIHPQYNPVVFIDGEHQIVTKSVLSSKERMDIDGVEHHVIHIEVSSYTHPFFTGKQRLVDTEGRVERFRKRWNMG
ncbi:MAG: type B 50S ribosomal protein L31 [Myxococcales bacterium]|nr:type B 50S ribosomal protein L31 [Myxococcales bacterium]MCB9523601.1 50S ribosomal protein L31 [Myxococcales bacterium]